MVPIDRRPDPATIERLEHLMTGLQDDGTRITSPRQALRFGSAFQPIFSLSHGRVVGHEALLRAQDADGRPVAPPDVFATDDPAELLARDRIARLVHLGNFLREAPPGQWIFLNVHPAAFAHDMHLGDDGFLPCLDANFGLDARRVVLEVTEEAMQDAPAFDAAVAQARALGCLIAVDDFGAGHSNFDRVWRWRPEIVKLDRALVARAARDVAARRIVEQMVSLLHECGALVLMEGVETPEEAVVALDADVDLVQGYLFGRPQPALTPEGAANGPLELAWGAFEQAWKRDRERHQAHTAPYLAGIAQAADALAAGASLAQACQPFLALPATEVCYLLGDDGRQIGTHHWAPSPASRAHPYKPLEVAEGARWARRSYFRRAIARPGELQITRPYRTLHGGDLCVTVSMAFERPEGDEGPARTEVLCGDVRWDA
jgi:EAL domain-containing protein (putative c-di-GMP-specific phosphodiesterase class I)